MRKYQQGFIVPSMPQLLIIAVIVALIFGTKKLVTIGKDVGGMFKGVKDGFREATSAVDELAPEVRETIDDAKRLRAHGTDLARQVRPSDLTREELDARIEAAIDARDLDSGYRG